ncbi:hypothetical protein INT45_014183 [Circinella minor]|uniref:Uncharacterized protein n=1 Tax=Circinella minor TaxID=1195481 RepID=A0A8H7RT17_9FUNG|nr:hypothetical protein INT45_014183 [Circinella minor]
MPYENPYVTFFKKRYPNGYYSEVAPAYFNAEIDRYDKFTLDIGWAMRSVHSNRRIKKGTCRHYKRICNGFVACNNVHCTLYMLQCRPAISSTAVQKQTCISCTNDLVHDNTCKAYAFYFFEGSTCTLEHHGEHNHNQMDDNDDDKNNQPKNPPNYLDKHLSYKQQQQLDVYLGIDKKDSKPRGFEAAPPSIRKAKALATGVLDKKGTLAESVRTVNPVLGNLDRLSYENRKRGLNKERESTQDLFADFEELEQEYPHFFTSANITSGLFIITFRAPLMIKYTSFRAFSCVTDVTYSAFQKARYLCSTAVIGGLTTEYFHQYFLALFSLYKIDFSSADNFMGMVMDFSLAQKNGFLSAYTQLTGMTNGLQYLKGCYMHWMQSVQRISSIHAVVPNNNRTRFLELPSNLRTIPTITDFDNVCNSILNEFPNARRWLRWWLQPDVHSMIFVSGSIMKSNLRGQPLRKTLRQALKIAKSDQDDLSQFYEYGMLTTYNHQPRLRKSRKIGTNHYAQSNSRAPDNTDAIFGDEKQLKKQELEKQKAAIQQPIDTTKVSDQRASLTVDDRNKIMHSDGMGISFMEEPELPSLEVDDPAIQNELKRIKVIEDYDNDLFIKSYESENDDSLQTLLSLQEEYDYIDTDDFDAINSLTTTNSIENTPQQHPAKKRKVESLPVSTGYDLSLTANSVMSCYIDAIMELMWHCLMPRISLSLLDVNNIFDYMLKATYELTLVSRQRDASERMRAFIFENFINFHRGQMHDTCELAIQYIARCSQQFKDLFIIRRQRVNECLHDQEHICFMDASTDVFSEISHVIKLNPSSLNEANVLNGPPQGFTDFFARYLHKFKENSSCFFCQEPATTYYLPLHALPPFLFIHDNTFSLSEDTGNIPFPYNMALQFTKYQLIAIISSTEKHGFHFKTTSIIQTPNEPFITSFDNMKRPGIKVLSEKVEEFSDIFAKITYPVLACYQKV